MKIGIIYIGDIKYAPFLKKYQDILESLGAEFDVLYWNREKDLTIKSSNIIPFEKYSKLSMPRVMKLFDFLMFGLWCTKRIKNNKYDKLILLTTLSGMILYRTLKHNYKGRYIFDIRDYTYEGIRTYLKYENKIIANSSFTALSSPYFKSFLGKSDKYIIAHNYTEIVDRTVEIKPKKNKHINLGFVGSLRYFDYQQKIIDALGNDDRFDLHYYGTGPEFERYKKYVVKCGYSNIILHGGYDHKDRNDFMKSIDILNNSYGNSGQTINNMSPEIRYAISNKYYDGLQLYIPQLVEIGSYKCERVERLGLGFGIDVDDLKFGDKLYSAYQEIDMENLRRNAELEIRTIKEEDREYTQSIERFVYGIEE